MIRVHPRKPVDSFDEKRLYEIEKRLIERIDDFNEIVPRPIEIIDSKDFAGQACLEKIQISSSFLNGNPTLSDVEDLLTHELLHILLQDEGHSIDFLNVAEKLQIDDDYSRIQLISELNKSMLEGRVYIRVDESGVETVYTRDHPSWEGFKELITYHYLDMGTCLKRLRECYSLSLEEVAERAKMSEIFLSEIESGNYKSLFYTEEETIEKIFHAIIKISK